jgi:hypothetical protein
MLNSDLIELGLTNSYASISVISAKDGICERSRVCGQRWNAKGVMLCRPIGSIALTLGWCYTHLEENTIRVKNMQTGLPPIAWCSYKLHKNNVSSKGWHLLQWQLADKLANERSGVQCMYLAGASINAAVSPVFLKTYTLCSYLST